MFLKRSDKNTSVSRIATRVSLIESQTCAHNPFAVLANPDALASLLELEVLQQFNPIRILRIML